MAAIAPGRAVFTPSIASEILSLNPRTLMIYESESLIKPQRTALKSLGDQGLDLNQVGELDALHEVSGDFLTA